MRKVLFIAYSFPPIGGGGVHRSAKFVKYLPQFGWQPYVISTTASVGSEGFDESLLADVPTDTPVWRIPTPNPAPITRFDRWNRRYLKSKIQTSVAPSTAFEPSTASGSGARTAASRRSSWRVGLKYLWRAAIWPLWPIEKPPVDHCLYWSLRIVPLALKLIRQHQADLIYTTCPPWSPHVTGLLLQRLSGLPWVADFRDPWTGNDLVYHHTGWRRAVDQYLERMCLAHSNAVVSVTPLQLAGLQGLAPMHSNGTKFHTITNGYDAADFSHTPRSKNINAPYTVLHAGVIYPDTIEPLLAALEQLVALPDLVARLGLYLVGDFYTPIIRRQIERSPASAMVRLHARVPHADFLTLLRESAVVLLLMGRTPHWSTIYPGKIFELMACGKPILAIAPEGVAAELVRESGTGCVVRPDDVTGLTIVLREIALDYDAFRRKYYHPRPEVIQRYERRRLTQQLAQLFDEVLAR